MGSSTSHLRRLAALALVFGFVALAAPGTAGAADVVLRWTAPGDDGNVGTASNYIMRYSLQPISGTDTLDWWSNLSNPVANLPTPRVAGTRETFTQTALDSGTVYYYLIRTCDDVLNCSGYSNLAVKVAGVNPPPGEVASVAMIGYPNPAKDHVTFRFQAGANGGQARLMIYDLNGRRVIELVDEVLPAGEQTVLWSCQSDQGNRVAPGIYNAILTLGSERQISQVLVMP